ncbi:MAG: helicase [Bacillota bacterium]|jgi:ATP-dependent RNA helicase DeaD|nr:helicase [Bacillota bacterium]
MENILFKDLNLSNEVQKALSAMGFEEATPIQSKAIPPIFEGKDIIGMAQTGTGKTCAFGIPAVEMLDPNISGVQVLILSPTRELAIQISEELKNVCKFKKGIKLLPIYGGQSIERQIQALKGRPQIIIGTPGRVMDHMRRHTLKLANLKMIILDEADEMLNMGFREDIDTILAQVPEERQTLLFSATMASEIMDLTKLYQKDPMLIKTVHKELTIPSIEQYYLEVRDSSKPELLCRMIDAKNIKLGLVFCNTKKRVDDLTIALQTRGYSAEALHGDMKQSERDRVMNKFRKGMIEILVATDVAARGIDVNNIEAVFNYDIPNDEEYYVHRIGRTGRAGKTGVSYSFIFGRDIYKLKDIQRYTKSEILPMKPPTITDVEEVKLEASIGKVLSLLESPERYTKYHSTIEKILAESADTTTLDVAGALFSMAFEELDNRNYEYSDLDDDHARYQKTGMTRLFMNIGTMDHIQPKHIVQTIAAKTSLAGKLIGEIDIHKNFTFVEIPSEFADEVMDSMRNYTHRGRKVQIEKAAKRQGLKNKPNRRR